MSADPVQTKIDEAAQVRESSSRLQQELIAIQEELERRVSLARRRRKPWTFLPRPPFF